MIKTSLKWVALALTLSASLPTIGQKKLTNEAVWYSNTFRMDYVSGFNSMKDGLHFTRLEYDRGGTAIGKYDFKSNNKIGTILSSTQLTDLVGSAVSIDDYTFSADESKLMIATAQMPIYRHSSKSNYYVYDITSKKAMPLSDPEKGMQRLAEFSPDGTKVAFVRNNDLFVLDLSTNKETQITTDGEENKIINGATDWVYEEEFGFDKGFYWSEDSRFIAFYRFDEGHVRQYQMPIYGSLYPEMYTFKYPKAGEANAYVTIHIYDINADRTRAADIGTEQDQYIPRIKWASGSPQLCIMRMNRLQNKLEFLLTRADVPYKTGLMSKVIFTETSDTYVEVTDNWKFLPKGDAFLWTSEMSGYNHIWKIGLDGSTKQITSGDYDVVELKGVDFDKELIYYISAEESAMERHLYSIGMNGKGKKKLTNMKGQNDAIFSAGMKYYVNYHSSANTPYHITIHDNKGKLIHTLVDNAQLKERAKEYGFQPKEFITVPTESGQKLNAWMIKPPNFDENKAYPLFMTVYGGPGINTVNDSWDGRNLYWHQMLAQQGYVVVSVDGRGTGYRGAEFKKVTYQQLGKYEIIDQIEAAKYLGGLKYIDASRIGIQGWSYGGYMSSLAITKGADVFKMAIAVAPVTNWRFYDTIYTERYMRTPQENAEGYDDNSPINHVDKLKGKYLIVHGSADDNVHYQNAMEMIQALQEKGIPFEQASYPNKNHGIYGGKTRLHLFTKMTEFVLENL